MISHTSHQNINYLVHQNNHSHPFPSKYMTSHTSHQNINYLVHQNINHSHPFPSKYMTSHTSHQNINYLVHQNINHSHPFPSKYMTSHTSHQNINYLMYTKMLTVSSFKILIIWPGTRCSSTVEHLLMVDSLSYFSFQPMQQRLSYILLCLGWCI